MPVIEAHSLSKSYATNTSEVEALRDVDLQVLEGEFLTIMGPSGCGKSTLVHILGGLIRPTAGQVVFEDRPMSTLSDRELSDIRRHKVGFVFQLFNLVPVLSVEENVALPAIIAGLSPQSYAGRVDHLIEAVGLSERRRHLPSQLSGGEQQRAAIARALVMSPRVLLADEPTGNLDSQSGDHALSLFREFGEAGQTTVLVTHDPRVAAMGDRVVLMRDGSLVGQGHLEEADGDRAARVLSLIEAANRPRATPH